MPIRMICEKRHHIGGEDITYPAVFCDICSKRIEDAEKSGYYYQFPESSNPDDCYVAKMQVYFLHHDCYWKFRRCPENVGVKTDYGTFCRKDVFPSSWGNLTSFPIYLGRNLGMEINADCQYKSQFDDEVGSDLTEQTYPVSETGYVYFFVDNGCITRKVKVGHSKNVRERLRDLQVGSPTLLKCYGAVIATKQEESKAHNLLDYCHSHGEWFVFHKAKKLIDEWIENNKIVD